MLDVENTTVLVLGATGYVGLELCRQSVKFGMKTIAHIRPDSKQLGEWKIRFEGMGADVDSTPWNQDEMHQSIKRLKPDLIFITIGTTKKRMKKIQKNGGDKATGSYEKVDYGLTALAVEAASRAENKKYKPKIIYLSSIGTKQNTGSPYLQARYKAEQAVIASKLAYVIVRAPIISGPDRMEFRLMERIGAKIFDSVLGVASHIGFEKQAVRYHSIYAGKLAAGMLCEAFSESMGKTIYIDEWL